MVIRAIISGILSFASFIAHSQVQFRESGESYVSISGTSTLNSWTMTSGNVNCRAAFDLMPDGRPQKIRSLQFSLKSETLKSGHSAMDKNAYSTMNSEKYETIKFNLTDAKITGTSIQCWGDLEISGVSKSISTQAKFQMLPNGSMLCTGTQKLKMSEFGIEPPTFMFGTVTTGDEVTVSYTIVLTQDK